MSAYVLDCPLMSTHECQLPKLNVEGSSPFARSTSGVWDVGSYVAWGECSTVGGRGVCRFSAIYEKALTVKRNVRDVAGVWERASPPIPAGIYSHSRSSSSWLGCMRRSDRFGAAIMYSRSKAQALKRSPRDRAGFRRFVLAGCKRGGVVRLLAWRRSWGRRPRRSARDDAEAKPRYDQMLWMRT